MSTPAAKRRRIDNASQTLSKPFRSPFKKSPTKATDSQDSTFAAPPTNTPLAPKTTNTLLSDTSKKASFPAPSLPSATPSRPSRAKKNFSSPIQAAVLNADPDIAPLIRKQRELEKQLRELKEELDTAQQAKKIEAQSMKENPDGEIDEELVVLIGKWKAASRQAAEELFGQVRDRVNRMGGPRAWKESQKRQQEWQNSWDQEDEQANNDSDDEDGEAKEVEKRDIYAEYGIDPETENEKSQRPDGVGDTGELPGQEDEFTMAMMLRTLNVDLSIIGHDKQQQRWID